MFKKPHFLAGASLLAIPAVAFLGVMLSYLINPEIAIRTSNYERNYQLLESVQKLSLLATLLLVVSLWFLTCFFVVKAKERSYRWLCLTLLGPFGLIFLTMLGNKSGPQNSYQQFVGRMGIYWRTAYELAVFAVVWILGYQAMVLKREFMIRYEAATTGTSVAQIISIQNASSGMYAFSEGLGVLFLVVLFYLLWPICFRASHYLLKRQPMPIR